MAKRKDNRGRILRNGEVQREDGKYMFRYNDINGERRTIYSWKLVETDSVPAGKRECVALRVMEKKVLRDVDDQILTYEAEKMTVDQLFETFMEMRIDLSDNTKYNYRLLYETHVRPIVGDKSIKRIKNSEIRAMYLYFFEKKHLKISTVEKMQAILTQMFALMVNDQVIRVNPCTDALKYAKSANKKSIGK